MEKTVIIWTCSGHIINKVYARTKQRKKIIQSFSNKILPQLKALQETQKFTAYPPALEGNHLSTLSCEQIPAPHRKKKKKEQGTMDFNLYCVTKLAFCHSQVDLHQSRHKHVPNTGKCSLLQLTYVLQNQIYHPKLYHLSNYLFLSSVLYGHSRS